MDPHERNALLLRYLDGSPLRDEQHDALEKLLREDPEAARLLAELAVQETLLRELGEGARRTQARTRRRSARPDGLPALVAGASLLAAAGLVLAALYGLRGGESPRSTLPTAPPTASAPPPALPNEPPPPEPSPGPKTTEPSPAPPAAPPTERPLSEPPAPPPAMPSLPVPVPAPTPPPPPPPPSRTIPPPPAPAFIVLSQVRGSLQNRAPQAAETIQIAPGTELAASPRLGASFSVPGGWTLWMDRSSRIRLDRAQTEGLELSLEAGAVFLESRSDSIVAPVRLQGARGTVEAASGAFQADDDGRRLQVAVQAGQVRLSTPRGHADLRPGQRAAARANERPSAPAAAEVEALSAWRRRPILSPLPPAGPFIDHERGHNPRAAGLVIAVPYADGEADAARVARATAETLDSGLVLAFGYRRPGASRWFHLDRGLEADVTPEGVASGERATEAARAALADYLVQGRAAAGLRPRDPVPLWVQFRTHYLRDAQGPLMLGEVALAGWNRAAAARLKAFYARLLERHRPARALELKFQGVDDTYEWSGARRTLLHDERDARDEGYMAPRNARAAVAFFLPAEFGREPAEAAAYGRIFAEFLEFALSQRR